MDVILIVGVGLLIILHTYLIRDVRYLVSLLTDSYDEDSYVESSVGVPPQASGKAVSYVTDDGFLTEVEDKEEIKRSLGSST